jgi:hypothetical protein
MTPEYIQHRDAHNLAAAQYREALQKGDMEAIKAAQKAMRDAYHGMQAKVGVRG